MISRLKHQTIDKKIATGMFYACIICRNTIPINDMSAVPVNYACCWQNTTKKRVVPYAFSFKV
jgi:hypothetical protein